MSVRISLIHATPVAIQPILDAFAAGWPEAKPVNLLDDSLTPDRAAVDTLTPDLRRRFVDLACYAHRSGAKGILFTCSAFGEAIEFASQMVPVPVLKPNEAMFDDALERGRRLGLLATFEPSVPSMAAEFEAMARARGLDAELVVEVVPEAMARLRIGDVEGHNRRLADAAPRLAGCDAVMLAHFSTAQAHAAVAERLPCPLLSAPDSAVAALRLRTG
jgi:aspartate/glutamate racemase